MEDRQLDARESFELIGRMIQTTRNQMERHSGRPLLIWGYVTIAVTLVVWLAVWQTGDPRWNFLWAALPVGGYLLTRLTRPRTTQGRVHTFVDRVIGQIWLVVGLAAWYLSTLTILDVASPSILFSIVLMMGIGTAITGLVVRFTPCTVGGAAGILLAPLLLMVPHLWQPGLFILAFILMMIIPGHILNHHAKRITNGKA